MENSNLDFKASIDLNNPAHVAAAIAFLSVFSGESNTVSQSAPPDQKKTSTTRANKAKTSEEKQVSEKSQEAEKPAKDTTSNDKQVDTGESDDSNLLDKIREVMPVKLANNKDAIKEKLSGFGAKGLSTLKPENFEEYLEFLESLTD